MELKQLFEIMAKNSERDENGQLFASGHVLSGVMYDGAEIEAVTEKVMDDLLYRPERFELVASL